MTSLAEEASGRAASLSMTLAERTHSDILQLITTAPLAIGARLPTEAAFCQMFGVSRVVVRVALARLKEEGVIESRQGRGSTVLRRPSEADLSFPAAGNYAEIQKIYEFRAEIEPGIAALAARNATAAEIRAIRAALEDFQRAHAAGNPAIDEDLRLHLAIAAAAHNSFFQAAIAALGPHFVHSIEQSRRLSRAAPGVSHQEAHDEHLAILQAIEARAPDLARQAMSEHLEQTRMRAFRRG